MTQKLIEALENIVTLHEMQASLETIDAAIETIKASIAETRRMLDDMPAEK